MVFQIIIHTENFFLTEGEDKFHEEMSANKSVRTQSLDHLEFGVNFENLFGNLDVEKS